MLHQDILRTDEIEVKLRPPTWRRFFQLFFLKKNFSVLRDLEYEIFAEIPLSGCVLDIGGGAATDYYERIKQWSQTDNELIYESVNIDATAKPTYVVKPGEKLPVASGKYNVIISLNTFEHIYDLQHILAESYRVLEVQGRLFFTVPFMFRVHGCPNDFIRGTPSYWYNILSNNKFQHIEIEAITWGPFSTGLNVCGIPGPLKFIRQNFALMMDIIYFQSRYMKQSKFSWKQDHQVCNAPLGYLISAQKISTTV
ncbi:bifunctional 2-polyprenyl-6-hydroxyphenol methylase/3-demethylubiquinol 3-O-methyltransferase UbiG [Halomicronema sp. CCY15110]|uniref:class I SAM-dependent methyltransferase n=1 Tax=Halomicronema sp. CCY15110 TaxID=2767773 RepID=UPI001951512A|nr:methyltransferase domain-containing protein [Halomicronema sp. CCY15110]